MIFVFVLVFGQSYSQDIVTEKDVKTTYVKKKLMKEAPKKVFINTFKVYYQLIDSQSETKKGGRQVGGGAYKGDATATLAVGIKGVELNTLQEITNDFYNKLIADLEADGLEVFTAKTIKKIDYYQDHIILEGPNMNQEQLEGYVMVAPEGYSYFVKGISKKGKEKKKFKLVNTNYKVSKQLDDMIVVDVTIVIPSIWLKEGVNLAGAKVKGGADLKLAQSEIKTTNFVKQTQIITEISFVSGKDKVAAMPATSVSSALKKDVEISGVFSDEKFKSVANKDLDNTAEYGNIFEVDNRTVKVTNYIECENDVYKAKVSQAIEELMNISYTNFRAVLKGK